MASRSHGQARLSPGFTAPGARTEIKPRGSQGPRRELRGVEGGEVIPGHQDEPPVRQQRGELGGGRAAAVLLAGYHQDGRRDLAERFARGRDGAVEDQATARGSAPVWAIHSANASSGDPGANAAPLATAASRRR